MLPLRAGLTWGVDFSCAVVIIILNKILMQKLQFMLPVTLTALHFCSTALYTYIAANVWRLKRVFLSNNPDAFTKTEQTTNNINVQKKERDTYVDTQNATTFTFLLFAALSTTSIVLSNASLCVNSVPFYQIMKLPTLFLVALIEMCFRVYEYDREDALIFSIILTGTAVTIRGHMTTSAVGFFVAFASIVATGFQQFYCGHLQRRYKLSPSDLLAKVTPFMAFALLLLGPLLDKIFFDRDIRNVHWDVATIVVVSVTCTLAVMLNIANYSAIHLLGSGTYQALNQLKTITVILVGLWYFHHPIENSIWLGLTQAVAGTCLFLLRKSKKQSTGSPNIV